MRLSKVILGGAALALALAGAACTESPANTSNVAANAAASNSNAATATNANSAAPAAPAGAAVNPREPERYSATYAFSGQTSGATQAAASMTMEVARDGANRRYAFSLPAPVGKIVILDKPDKRYLLIEGQRRYVELTPQVTGIQLPRSMSPGDMVAQLQRTGVESLGEVTVEVGSLSRAADKYRVAGQAQTGTQAGQASGETILWVDKETGLPLRVEATTSATGQVQGVSGGTMTMVIRDYKTNVDAALFEIPQGYTAMTEQEIRQWQQVGGALLQMAVAMVTGGGAPAR